MTFWVPENPRKFPLIWQGCGLHQPQAQWLISNTVWFGVFLDSSIRQDSRAQITMDAYGYINVRMLHRELSKDTHNSSMPVVIPAKHRYLFQINL